MDVRRGIALNTLLQSIAEQSRPLDRVALVRISVAAVCAALLLLGPYGDAAVQFGRLLSPDWPWWALEPARTVGIIAAALVAAGVAPRASTAALALALGTVTFLASRYAANPWSYNTHLLFFLILLIPSHPDPRWSLFMRSGRRRPGPTGITLARTQLFSLQLLVGVLYLQAGVSKLTHGGLRWFWSGTTVQVYGTLMGTSIGQWIAQHPSLCRLACMGTGVLEFSFLPIVLFVPRLRRPLVVTAIMFHLGVYATLGISFWHLWALFPALFLAWGRPALRAPR